MNKLMSMSARQYAKAWYELLKGSDSKKWPQISQAMLNRLRADGKLGSIHEIERVMSEFENEDNGIIDVFVRVAHDLDEKDIIKKTKQLVQKDQVHVSFQKDASLLGGIVVTTCDHRWDLSMKRKLEELRSTLKK